MTTIWHTMELLKKDCARMDIKLDAQKTADIIHLYVPRIYHSVTVMVSVLAFHIEDPDGVWNTVSILLFLHLYPLVGLEEALIERLWDSNLG